MTRRSPAPPPRTSFWRYSLRHEWIAAAAALGLFISAGALSLRVLHNRYLELQQADANRVKHHLHLHLGEALAQLEAFLERPPQRWPQEAAGLLPAFSDLYVLGERDQVGQVLKAVDGSHVFPGFSFAGTAISPYLQAGRGWRPAGTTPVFRGLEDEMTSIYVLRRAHGRRLLGRIQLGYIKRFLQRYSAFSGTPTLLVSRDGFLMLSGSEELRVSNIDLRQAGGGGALEPLVLGDRTWLPVASAGDALGVRIVTLLPDDHLAPLRQVLLTAGAAVLLLCVPVFLWKNHRLRRELFTPVGRFAAQIQAQENRLRRGMPAQPFTMAAATRFEELAALQGSFERLMQAIIERDRSLQQVRRREQRQEERQRRELRSKLHSSLMAASIAHEINLPLSTIRMLCHQARGQLLADDPRLDVSAVVDSLSQQSQVASAVVEKMRMLLRNVQCELQPTDPVEVLKSACLAVKPLLRREQVQLELRGLEPAPSLRLQGDAVPLQMAVTNLLRNAIEAAAECPAGLRRVRLGLGCEEGGVLVEVADSGPGFLVDPGEEAPLHTDKPAGSGLGLFVVRTTMDNHRGRVSFGRCRELGGARVCLHLPLPAEEEEEG
ncbi:MAG: HAMP domain-containing sensor histidine kinase [Synechococcaceae cyanobacterium]|nr:HAMP domain-containing sensor histidine kinase [Synechococcaceae cyanobacterium]